MMHAQRELMAVMGKQYSESGVSPQDGAEHLGATGDSPNEIMTRVAARMAERQAAWSTTLDEAQGSAAQFGVAEFPAQPKDSGNAELHRHLREVNAEFADLHNEPILAESPATRVPVLGKIWASVRQHAHELVLFYVNRGTFHQLSVNRRLVSVVNLLTAQLEEQRAEIAQLRRDLARHDDADKRRSP